MRPSIHRENAKRSPRFTGRLFLIDGSSFFYRAFYAVRSLSTSRGQPTNAVFGVAAMLMKLLTEEKPDFLGVALDTPKPTFRHEVYQAYKIHRPPMPVELASQIPWIKELLAGWRIPVFEKEGFEADDVLATMAVRAAREGLSVYLVTGDKDALQLLDPSVVIYKPTREGHEVVDAQALQARLGIRPDQVVEVMALMGDETDNIPGVKGIGEKTAVELIQRFSTVENLLKHLEGGEIRPAVARAIRNDAKVLELSRRLALLDREVPIEWAWDDLKVLGPDAEKMKALFRTLEFRSLLASWFPEKAASKVRVRLADGKTDWGSILSEVRSRGRLAVSAGPAKARAASEPLLGIGLSWKAGEALAVPAAAGFDPLREILTDAKVLKVVPRLKEALGFFARSGLDLAPPWTDPSLASYLLNPSRTLHDISDLSQELLSETIEDPDPLVRSGLAAEAALRIEPGLAREIREKELEKLLTQIELPLARVLAKMEARGIALDRQALEELARSMEEELARLTKEIFGHSGQVFNINSPKQLSQILFEKLKLPVVKRTKTGASTDEEVLTRLAAGHPLPAKLLEFREISKLRSTYVEALPKLVDPQTGRLHTSFNQTVTATGRLSSSDPNLQNIPIRTALGRQIRKAFVPGDPSQLFLAADYSQVELRILAHLSRDAALLAAFGEGQDIHRATASEIFHLTPEKVSDRQRSAAKTINFGIVYGMTPFGLAKELGMGPREAEDFIDRYFQRYPGVKRYLELSLEEARKRGYVTTLMNRRRYIPELASPDLAVRQFAERTAVNAPIQGSAADLIKAAMVALDARMEAGGFSARMLLTVHDELVFELAWDERQRLEKLVVETMESPLWEGRPLKLLAPLVVKIKTGRNWLEASHG